ncbi:MAG: 4-hydroxybenzoate octaprenyltransferase [Alphaproteobacteria bacterium]|nr:4-hydroxybenzoate octaprenyltransferase [Alphaproteobacteria bacterium]
MTHTDMRTDHPILRRLPTFLRPYVLLARLDRPVGIWLLLLPGWWSLTLAGAFPARWDLFALFGAGAVVMRAAGCVINDLWDRDVDRRIERTRLRPLAAGDISVRAALCFLAALLLVGFLILLQMNGTTIFLGFLSLPLIVIYPLMKRWTWWPQAFLGLTFNFGALMGWSAATGTLALPAFLLYVSGIFWTLGYDTVYAHQDRADDLIAGIKSTALKLGAYSKVWVMIFYALAWCFLAAAGMIMSEPGAPIVLLPAALHLIRQVYIWRPDDAENSLWIFRTNPLCGLLVLAGLGLIAAKAPEPLFRNYQNRQIDRSAFSEIR